MSYARFPEAAVRGVTLRLLPYTFEELEFFPGCICAGRAHFDVDQFGDWSIFSIELDGYHGPDRTLDQKSTATDGFIFNLICETLRRDHEDHILGRTAE